MLLRHPHNKHDRQHPHMTITITPAAPPPHIASFAIYLLAESKKFFSRKLSMMPSMSLKLSRGAGCQLQKLQNLPVFFFYNWKWKQEIEALRPRVVLTQIRSGEEKKQKNHLSIFYAHILRAEKKLKYKEAPGRSRRRRRKSNRLAIFPCLL